MGPTWGPSGSCRPQVDPHVGPIILAIKDGWKGKTINLTGLYFCGIYSSVRAVRLETSCLRGHGYWVHLGAWLSLCGSHGLLCEVLEASAACIIAHLLTGTAQPVVSKEECVYTYLMVFVQQTCKSQTGNAYRHKDVCNCDFDRNGKRRNIHEKYLKHDDVIKWRHFPRYWPFVRGIHRSRWIPHTKASDAELCCFLWSVLEQKVE